MPDPTDAHRRLGELGQQPSFTSLEHYKSRRVWESTLPPCHPKHTLSLWRVLVGTPVSQQRVDNGRTVSHIDLLHFFLSRFCSHWSWNPELQLAISRQQGNASPTLCWWQWRQQPFLPVSKWLLETDNKLDNIQWKNTWTDQMDCSLAEV